MAVPTQFLTTLSIVLIVCVMRKEIRVHWFFLWDETKECFLRRAFDGICCWSVVCGPLKINAPYTASPPHVHVVVTTLHTEQGRNQWSFLQTLIIEGKGDTWSACTTSSIGNKANGSTKEAYLLCYVIYVVTYITSPFCFQQAIFLVFMDVASLYERFSAKVFLWPRRYVLIPFRIGSQWCIYRSMWDW